MGGLLLLFCSFGVEPSPTAEIVSGRILAAPLFLEIVPQKGQYRGFRGYSPNRSIKVCGGGASIVWRSEEGIHVVVRP